MTENRHPWINSPDSQVVIVVQGSENKVELVVDLVEPEQPQIAPDVGTANITLGRSALQQKFHATDVAGKAISVADAFQNLQLYLRLIPHSKILPIWMQSMTAVLLGWLR